MTLKTREFVGWSVAKHVGSLGDNEDSWAADDERGFFAVSDGTSNGSFASSTWSAALVKQFVSNPLEFVARAQQSYTSAFQPNRMRPFRRRAYAQGSYATFAGAVTVGTDLVIVAVGDAIVALCEDGNVQSSFPLTEAKQFNDRPELIWTNQTVTPEYPFDGLHVCIKHVAKLRSPTLLLCTDALGAWLLAASGHRGRVLDDIPSFEEFAHLVQSERRSGELEVDDTTLLRVRLAPVA